MNDKIDTLNIGDLYNFKTDLNFVYDVYDLILTSNSIDGKQCMISLDDAFYIICFNLSQNNKIELMRKFKKYEHALSFSKQQREHGSISLPMIKIALGDISGYVLYNNIELVNER